LNLHAAKAGGVFPILVKLGLCNQIVYQRKTFEIDKR